MRTVPMAMPVLKTTTNSTLQTAHGMRLLPRVLLLAAATVAVPYGDRRTHGGFGHRPDDISFIHTFDTLESCRVRCKGICTQQHSEDLGMPRWLCSQQDDTSIFADGDEPDSSFPTNSLLISIPLVIFGSLFLLFVCVSCVQKFFRGV